MGAFPSFRRPTGAGPRQRKSGVKVHSRGWRRDQEQSCVSALLQYRKEGGGGAQAVLWFMAGRGMMETWKNIITH